MNECCPATISENRTCGSSGWSSPTLSTFQKPCETQTQVPKGGTKIERCLLELITQACSISALSKPLIPVVEGVTMTQKSFPFPDYGMGECCFFIFDLIFGLRMTKCTSMYHAMISPSNTSERGWVETWSSRSAIHWPSDPVPTHDGQQPVALACPAAWS